MPPRTGHLTLLGVLNRLGVLAQDHSHEHIHLLADHPYFLSDL
jgi:hypothetical protein